MRPRNSSVAADSRIDPRTTMETMSAAPASARKATAIHRLRLWAKPVTRHLPGLHHGRAEGARGGPLVLGDEPGDGGVAGRRVLAPEGLLNGEQHQRGHRLQAGDGLEPEEQRGDGDAAVGDQQQPAAAGSAAGLSFR